MKMLPCSAFLLPLVLGWSPVTAQPTPALPLAKTVTLVCEESPPFNYEEKGEIVGIASDIIRESFRRAGYGVVFERFPWARALAVAQGGTVDGIFCLYKTSEREKTFVFSRRFASDTQSFFVLSDAKITFDGHLQRMGTYTIGTVRGYSYGERFDSAVDSGILGKTEPVSNVDQNIQKLLSKRIDAFIEGEYLGLAKLKALNLLGQVRVLEVKVNEPGLHVGFSRKRRAHELAAAFNKGLTAIQKDGTYARIIAHYTQ